MEQSNAEPRIVLLVTAMPGAEKFAATLSESASVVIEVARSRRAALAALRRQSFAAVVVDAGLPGNEVTQKEMVWQNIGVAVPLELDLAKLESAAVIRLLRSVLNGCRELEAIVREDVGRSMAENLRSTVTGMLLQADLALCDRTLSPVSEQRFRRLRFMADDLRIRLRAA